MPEYDESGGVCCCVCAICCLGIPNCCINWDICGNDQINSNSDQNNDQPIRQQMSDNNEPNVFIRVAKERLNKNTARVYNCPLNCFYLIISPL